MPIICVFIKSRCVARKGYLEEGHLMPQERIGSESYPKCKLPVDVQLL